MSINILVQDLIVLTKSFLRDTVEGINCFFYKKGKRVDMKKVCMFQVLFVAACATINFGNVYSDQCPDGGACSVPLSTARELVGFQDVPVDSPDCSSGEKEGDQLDGDSVRILPVASPVVDDQGDQGSIQDPAQTDNNDKTVRMIVLRIGVPPFFGRPNLDITESPAVRVALGCYAMAINKCRDGQCTELDLSVQRKELMEATGMLHDLGKPEHLSQLIAKGVGLANFVNALSH